MGGVVPKAMPAGNGLWVFLLDGRNSLHGLVVWIFGGLDDETIFQK